MRSWEELSKNEQLACTYSDAYKEVYNFRPHVDTSDWDEARFEREFKFLDQAFDEEQARKQEWEDAAWMKFLARVDEVMNIVQGCTPIRAVEIIADAEDIDLQDMGYFEYCLGLKYDTVKPWLKTQEN